ncbi:Uncharacterised protein [Clostridium putrefaciens]|uniref:Uncharacterized protein n=1 Tax=Clostridium putrefaciens TaxID=99675 RepID=A0A381JAC2_9CLOT|nr:hypothetical protein [Clostridium putrefaciens]SUY48055.1 Uncharacterised protein [Clostridium putrefaciens]
MKIERIKHYAVSALLAFLALLINGVLKGINAPSIMYMLVWIPIIICFIYDFKYIYKLITK